MTVISVYSEPNARLIGVLHGTFISCQYFGDDTLVIVEAFCILSVVAMVPHELTNSWDNDRHFFVVEWPGLDVADLDWASEKVLE